MGGALDPDPVTGSRRDHLSQPMRLFEIDLVDILEDEDGPAARELGIFGEHHDDVSRQREAPLRARCTDQGDLEIHVLCSLWVRVVSR
jgi:hypothetical protein